jgi:scyllo-inositol 2-dehydrogenase (NADP+)
MIATVVVGYGLAGRAFHCPLIRRQRDLRLHGIVARDPHVRAQSIAHLGDDIRTYAHLDDALADPDVQLVVIATPHDSHAALCQRTLDASRHCVVDKVMALSASEADAMIAARDRAGCLLSVFHNRRWDWDFQTVRGILANGELGRTLIIESSVCRDAPPRGWRGNVAQAGTILHDWGAHLIDQALQLNLGPCRRLSAWLTPGNWEGVDSWGHGRIVLKFDDVLFQVESSRICRLDRPRWWIIGTRCAFIKYGIDPQESALRDGDIDTASELPEHQGVMHGPLGDGTPGHWPIPTTHSHWDAYYRNVADAILGRAPLAVTAEDGREVVRVLDAAVQSAREQRTIQGYWGSETRR